MGVIRECFGEEAGGGCHAVERIGGKKCKHEQDGEQHREKRAGNGGVRRPRLGERGLSLRLLWLLLWLLRRRRLLFRCFLTCVLLVSRFIRRALFIFLLVRRDGEWVFLSFPAWGHFTGTPAEAIDIDFDPGVGVVIIDGEGVEPFLRQGGVLEIFPVDGKTDCIAGRDARGAEQHDGGGGKGGAVAFSAFCQEVGDKVFVRRRFARIFRIGVVILQKMADGVDACALLGKALRGAGLAQRGDGVACFFRNGEVVRVDEAAVTLFRFKIGRVVGVLDGFTGHHREERTGRELPYVGAVGLALAGDRRAVILEVGTAEVGIIGEEQEAALFVEGSEGEGLLEGGKVILFGVVQELLGDRWISGSDLHEPGSLVVPFALVLGKEGFCPVIGAVREVLPAAVFVEAAGPASDVEVLIACRFDVCDDAACIADAGTAAEALMSGGALHHARVGIAGVEDRVIGVTPADDLLLHMGEDRRLLIPAFREREEKPCAQKQGQSEGGDLRHAESVVFERGKDGKAVGGAAKNGESWRVHAEVEAEENEEKGKKRCHSAGRFRPCAGRKEEGEKAGEPPFGKSRACDGFRKRCSHVNVIWLFERIDERNERREEARKEGISHKEWEREKEEGKERKKRQPVPAGQSGKSERKKRRKERSADRIGKRTAAEVGEECIRSTEGTERREEACHHASPPSARAMAAFPESAAPLASRTHQMEGCRTGETAGAGSPVR